MLMIVGPILVEVVRVLLCRQIYVIRLLLHVSLTQPFLLRCQPRDVVEVLLSFVDLIMLGT
jgi:hypothetical protein